MKGKKSKFAKHKKNCPNAGRPRNKSGVAHWKIVLAKKKEMSLKEFTKEGGLFDAMLAEDPNYWEQDKNDIKKKAKDAKDAAPQPAAAAPPAASAPEGGERSDDKRRGEEAQPEAAADVVRQLQPELSLDSAIALDVILIDR